jgi:branched-chain amino acid transport system substrate-binding protein
MTLLHAFPFRRQGVAAIAIAACLGSRSVLAADPYEIPVIMSLTGNAAFQGRGIQQSLQVLQEVVNAKGGIGGRPVQFQFQDDQSNPQIGVQLMNAVVARNGPVVLGSVTTATCQAMAAAIREGPVMYCLSPGVHPDEGSYLFSANVSSIDSIDVSIRWFREQNLRRIAVLNATDATGQDGDRAIDAAIAALRGQVTIVEREHFNPTDISVAAQMAKIKAANPQALLSWTTGTPAATVFRALKEAALDIPVVTSYGNGVHVLMTQQWASFLPANLYITAEPNLAPAQVTDRGTKAALDIYFPTIAKLGIQPDVVSAGGWDAALLVIDAIRKAGPNATAAQIRNALAGTRNWAGIFGRYDFKAIPQRGIGRNSMYMARWDAAKQNWVAVTGPAGSPLK